MAKKTKNKKSVQSLDELYLDAIVADEDILDDDVFTDDTSVESSKAKSVVDHDDLPLDGLDLSEDIKRAWRGKGLKCSTDHMTVTLWVKGGLPISSEIIRMGFDKLGIQYGIDSAALQQAEDLTEDPDWQGELVVARGSDPEVSRKIKYVLMQVKEVGTDQKQWLVDGVELDFDKLQDVFVSEDLLVLKEAVLMVKAVRPGDSLIKIIDNPNARPGKDVFGSILDVVEEPIPLCGPNVRLNEKNRCIEATLFGYLSIVEEVFSVQLPVWMQPDHLAAFYINFPQVGTVTNPTAKDIFNILVLMGINKHCVSAKNIKLVSQKIVAGEKLKTAMVAEAVLPITGRDADFELSFDTEKKAGAVREDGSIDLRERNAVVAVNAGQLIAEKTNATNGVSGVTLLGKKIAAPDGKDKTINFGDGVRCEKSAEKIKYYAAINGNVHFSNNMLTVVNVMRVDGDIAYATGNLDVNTDIEISGSVVAGFKVKAKGCVFINGSVENGATVIAGGELIVKNGILGEDTRVISMGDLQVGFIQDAEVLAKGNVVVSSYLYNARLRANGTITVLKGQGKRSGRVIGGVCCSSKSISICYAGSSSSSGTLLSIQPDPELNGKLKKIEEMLQVHNNKISRISRTLPFESFNPKQIKAYISKIPAAQKVSVLKLLKVLNDLIKLQKRLRAKRDIINGQVNFALQHGVVRVSAGIYQGCVIEFGCVKMCINHDMGESLFEYDNDNIKIQESKKKTGGK